MKGVVNQKTCLMVLGLTPPRRPSDCRLFPFAELKFPTNHRSVPHQRAEGAILMPLFFSRAKSGMFFFFFRSLEFHGCDHVFLNFF